MESTTTTPNLDSRPAHSTHADERSVQCINLQETVYCLASSKFMFFLSALQLFLVDKVPLFYMNFSSSKILVLNED